MRTHGILKDLCTGPAFRKEVATDTLVLCLVLAVPAFAQQGSEAGPTANQPDLPEPSPRTAVMEKPNPPAKRIKLHLLCRTRPLHRGAFLRVGVV